MHGKYATLKQRFYAPDANALCLLGFIFTLPSRLGPEESGNMDRSQRRSGQDCHSEELISSLHIPLSCLVVLLDSWSWVFCGALVS